MARAVLGMTEIITSSECRSQNRRVQRDGNIKCRGGHNTCHDVEEMWVATQGVDAVRSKIFNFHGVRSVIIAKLKEEVTKDQQHANVKINTGSDGILMPIRMYKTIFPIQTLLN